ncbi:restriction endonuclease [Ureibacillus sp. FSL W7-1570]|jgi:hypothetical protein|uniref:restriction endonuclease n=1 Tax=Ureibacillus sp. FSL W7-1570 TaxID=2954593 RepID=UPI00315B3356
MKQRNFGSKAIEFLMILMFSFGIVIALYSSFSINPDIFDLKLYLMLFITVIIFYKPFRVSSFRFLFYLICRMIHMVKNDDWEADLTQDHLQKIEYLYLLKSHFEKRGYVAIVTKELDGYDVDLILWKGTKKYIVQILESQKAVDIRRVQKIAAKRKRHGANGALIVSNQPFTASAKKYSPLHHIQLINQDELLKMNDEKKKYFFQSALSYILHHK